MMPQHLHSDQTVFSTEYILSLAQIHWRTMMDNMVCHKLYICSCVGSMLISQQDSYAGKLFSMLLLMASHTLSPAFMPATIIALFEHLIKIHGVPSHVHSDHGVENGIVA